MHYKVVQFSGFLLKKVLKDTHLKISGKLPARKLFLYSAHDYNLTFMLRILDLLTFELEPTYSSYIVIELHNKNGTYGFKVDRNIRNLKIKLKVVSIAVFLRELQQQRKIFKYSELRTVLSVGDVFKFNQELRTGKRRFMWKRRRNGIY